MLFFIFIQFPEILKQHLKLRFFCPLKLCHQESNHIGLQVNIQIHLVYLTDNQVKVEYYGKNTILVY